MTWTRPTILAIVALLIGCGSTISDETQLRDNEPSTEIDFETAQLRATELGRFLAKVESDLLERRDLSEQEGAEAVRAALIETFGPLQSKTEDGGWLVVGDSFRFVPGVCDSLRTIETTDGRPTMVNAGSVLLFYEYLVLDVTSGSLYQSYGQISAGCDTGSVEFYGPLVPPTASRIAGTFDREELRVLSELVHDSLKAHR